MNNLTPEQKREILDYFGKQVIMFRDSDLDIAINYATGKSVNPIKAEQYSILSTLSHEQRESINDLLSETITSTIFNFLNMFEYKFPNSTDYRNCMFLSIILHFDY